MKNFEKTLKEIQARRAIRKSARADGRTAPKWDADKQNIEWITVENGQHIPLDENKKAIGGGVKGMSFPSAKSEPSSGRSNSSENKAQNSASGNSPSRSSSTKPNAPKLKKVKVEKTDIDVADAIYEQSQGKENSLSKYIKDGKLTPERSAMHKQKIDEFFEGKEPTQGKKKMVMMGGGPASGKSSVEGLIGVSDKDSDTIRIDPDQFKEMLPGYKEMAIQTDEAAGYYHEESSALAKVAYGTALDNGVNAIYDGTGDGSTKSVRKKIKQARDAGYSVEGKYVTVDTEEAIKRNRARYESAYKKYLEDKEAGVKNAKAPRLPKEDLVRRTHRDVTDISVECAPEFDSIELYDNNGPIGSTKLIAKGGNGKGLKAVDREAFQRYLDKGQKKYRINDEGYSEVIGEKKKDGRSDSTEEIDKKELEYSQDNRSPRRWNQILRAVNEGDAPETIKPPLDKYEMYDYEASVKELEAERAKFKKDCEEHGIPYVPICYELAELD